MNIDNPDTLLFGLQNSTIRSQTFAFFFNDSMSIFVSHKWTRSLALSKKEAITISGFDDISEFLIMKFEMAKSRIVYRNDNSSCMIAQVMRFGDGYFFCPKKLAYTWISSAVISRNIDLNPQD